MGVAHLESQGTVSEAAASVIRTALGVLKAEARAAKAQVSWSIRRAGRQNVDENRTQNSLC